MAAVEMAPNCGVVVITPGLEPGAAVKEAVVTMFRAVMVVTGDTGREEESAMPRLIVESCGLFL